MNFRGAIFDFDGIVVDTTPLHYCSWEKLLIERHQQPFDEFIYETIVNGRRSKDVIPELLPHLTQEQQKEALAFKQNYYHKLIERGKVKVFTSTIKLIKELTEQNVKIGVASSSRSVALVLKKSNIHDLFHAIISSDDTALGKPHPESFLKAAEHLELNSKECIVFEDAKAGVQAAKNGGFLCVGVNRNNKPEHFQLADLVVSDLIELDHSILIELFNRCSAIKAA